MIAERFGTEHHEVLIDAEAMMEFLPSMIHHQDEPTADLDLDPPALRRAACA